jgi:hypothetical protein
MNNFEFLKSVDKNLYEIISDAEELYRDEYFEQCIGQTRRFGENVCKNVLGSARTTEKTFDDMLATLKDKSKEEKYQIIVTRAEAKKKVIQTCPDTTSSREWIIFSILLFLAFSLGIVLGYLVCKKDIIKKIFQKRKDKKIKEEEKKAKEEEKKLSDTIELDSTKILEKAKKK